MTDVAPSTDRRRSVRWRLSPAGTGALAAAVAAVAVVVWGGYGGHWRWTGINGSTATLWDWLHLLMLPIAFGLLPFILSRETRVKQEHKIACVAASGCLALLVVAGYAIPWSWTGFEGNKLWDWLELLALPLAVALIPVLQRLRVQWRPRHTVAAVAGLAVFGGIVIGGYMGNWSWTGFSGNTLWDWLHLLLLPLLLPTVIVPALVPVATSKVLAVEEPEADRSRVSPGPDPDGNPPTLVDGPSSVVHR